MTGTDFILFRQCMGNIYGMLSERKTAALMGCSRHSVRSWSKKGAPLYVALACTALVHSLKPWGEQSTKERNAA